MQLTKIFSSNQLEDTEDIYIEIIEKYINKGKVDIAFKTAGEAITKYPESTEIQTLYNNIKKETLINECNQLENLVDEKPSPVTFAKLGNAYRKLGYASKAIDICKEGEILFPEDGGNILVLGTLYYDQYQKSKDPKDALMSIEYLEKALKFGIDNIKAHFDLIKIYLELGAYGRAKKKIIRYQDLFPNDPKIKIFYEKVKNFSSNEEDIEELCKKNNDNNSNTLFGKSDNQHFINNQGVESIKPSSGNDFQRLIENMKIFDDADWQANILLIDENGFIITSKLQSEIAEDYVAASIKTIFQTADQFTQKILFADFKNCLIEGELTDIYINTTSNNMQLCIITQDKTKQGIVKAYIKKYLELI